MKLMIEGLGSLSHNEECDHCDKVQPNIVGVGPSNYGEMVEVLGFCFECLGIKDVADYEERVRKQWESHDAEYNAWTARQELEDAENEAAAIRDYEEGR